MDADSVSRALMAALEHEPRVDLHRDRIEVLFDDGTATVSGEVSDIGAKRLTLELAAALPPVRGIVDRLHVRPAARMGDGAIADHIERALAGDSAFDECALYRRASEARKILRPGRPGQTGWLETHVQEGVVTLDGDVPSLSHKRLAGALAWWVPGSRDVINGLGVEPPEQDSDYEILDALRLILEKDPLLDASQVRAGCRRSVVTLGGLVTSRSHRDVAEFDAWALFGVDRVVNHISVQLG